MIKQGFGSLVKQGRFFRNQMTQEELAQIVGVTRQTIVSIESGDTSPNIVLALMICNVLGLSLDTFLIDILKTSVSQNATHA